MTAPGDVADLTAVQMLELFESGALSPVEAARACLERIERLNDRVLAFCFVDEETTLEAARRSEERYRLGQPMGLLDGVPVAIKDMFATRGWPNLKGSTLIDPDGPWEVDAPVIAALRRHGMVPLGRTATPEFAWKGVTDSRLVGVTRNPWNPATTAGGSSGGSAAAVPLGMGPLSLGTDAGGSIRIPAGFCGMVGHKPTHGLVPMWPPSAFYPLAHVGPMTWTVEDTALLMNVLAEPDARDVTLPPRTVDYTAPLGDGVRGLRIAYSPRLGFDVAVDPEIAASVARAVATLESLGARVDEHDPGFADPRVAFERMFYGGAANALRGYMGAARAAIDPALVEMADWASELSMLDYLDAANQRAALIEQTSIFHETWDLLVTPTLPIPAFDVGKDGREVPEGWAGKRWHTWTPFTYPFNLTGQPAISVPCGFTSAGLPIGLQIIGARHQDPLVLRAAHAFQMAEPLTDHRPPLVDEIRSAP